MGGFAGQGGCTARTDDMNGERFHDASYRNHSGGCRRGRVRRRGPGCRARDERLDGPAAWRPRGDRGGWASGEYRNLGGPYGITYIKGQKAYFDAERGYFVR